jgi:hypothetical protein
VRHTFAERHVEVALHHAERHAALQLEELRARHAQHGAPHVQPPPVRARRLLYSGDKVANREIRDCALGDKKWLLNDGQIQNPSSQS